MQICTCAMCKLWLYVWFLPKLLVRCLFTYNFPVSVEHLHVQPVVNGVQMGLIWGCFENVIDWLTELARHTHTQTKPVSVCFDTVMLDVFFHGSWLWIHEFVESRACVSMLVYAGPFSRVFWCVSPRSLYFRHPSEVLLILLVYHDNKAFLEVPRFEAI